MEALANLLPFIVVLAALYLLMIRPARARQRAQLQLQASLAPGQKVITTSGLIATVSAVEDDEVLLEVSPGVTLRWVKAAVGRVLVEPTEADGQADDAVDAPAARAD